VLTKTSSPVGNRIDQCCALDSPVHCPAYDARAEFRGDAFDASATLYLQINTWDRYLNELRVREPSSANT
jgi:hypothetical protein